MWEELSWQFSLCQFPKEKQRFFFMCVIIPKFSQGWNFTFIFYFYSSSVLPIGGKIKKLGKETSCHWLGDRTEGEGWKSQPIFNFHPEEFGQLFGWTHIRMANNADIGTLKNHLLFLWKKKEEIEVKLQNVSFFFLFYFFHETSQKEGPL